MENIPAPDPALTPADPGAAARWRVAVQPSGNLDFIRTALAVHQLALVEEGGRFHVHSRAADVAPQGFLDDLDTVARALGDLSGNLPENRVDLLLAPGYEERGGSGWTSRDRAAPAPPRAVSESLDRARDNLLQRIRATPPETD